MRPLHALALALIVALPSSAAANRRDWQTGAVLESEAERHSQISGLSQYGRYDANVERTTWDEHTYLIEGRDRVFVISESSTRLSRALRIDRPAYLTPGNRVQYATEKDRFYILQDDGNEHQFHLVRISLKRVDGKP